VGSGFSLTPLLDVRFPRQTIVAQTNTQRRGQAEAWPRRAIPAQVSAAHYWSGKRPVLALAVNLGASHPAGPAAFITRREARQQAERA